MSFRLYVYYCALCGGGGGFIGWMFGRILLALLTWLDEKKGTPPPSVIVSDGLKALFVGLFVAAALSLVDALWVFSLRQSVSISLRVGTAVVIGSLGGMFGGLVPTALSDMVHNALPDRTPTAVFNLLDWFTHLFTWTITGTLIGVSVGTFDVVFNVLRGKDIRPAVRKTMRGLLGGALGGFIGGFFSLVLHGLWGLLFQHKPQDRLWSPSSSGFIILGLCIGLLIGLAQIILKEAWVRVEQGFRKGREMLLQKGEVTIGRAERCDIGLFGDPLVEKLHARIVQQNGQYFVVDAGSAHGTFVNEQRIHEPTPLRSGDAIRLGKCVLRFGERAKRQ
jgi:FHA domain